MVLPKTQDPMFDIDYSVESEDDGVFDSTKKPAVDTLVLIETQKNIDGKVFLIYSIQNSSTANNFMIAHELAQETSDVWDCNRPADCKVETMSQVLDFIATKTRKNVEFLDGSCRKRQLSHKHSEYKEKYTERVREGTKQGTVHSWNSSKGYGFVQEDETGANIFFHTSRLVHREWLPIKGQRVEYKLQFNSNKMRETAVGVYTIRDHVPNYRHDRIQQTFDNNRECNYKHARFI